MLEKERSALILVDIQGKLADVVVNSQELLHNILKLIRTAQLFQLPILWVEQYPEGLGPTKSEISDQLSDLQPIAKRTFSSMGCEEFREQLIQIGRSQLLVTGIEAHVCVYQTTLDLIDQGYECHLVTDAVSSRAEENRALGIHRMEQAGAILTSTEMALFELMKDSRDPLFRQLIQIVKD